MTLESQPAVLPKTGAGNAQQQYVLSLDLVFSDQTHHCLGIAALNHDRHLPIALFLHGIREVDGQVIGAMFTPVKSGDLLGIGYKGRDHLLGQGAAGVPNNR